MKHFKSNFLLNQYWTNTRQQRNSDNATFPNEVLNKCLYHMWSLKIWCQDERCQPWKPGQTPTYVITFCLPEQFSVESQLDISALEPLHGLAVSGSRKGLCNSTIFCVNNLYYGDANLRVVANHATERLFGLLCITAALLHPSSPRNAMNPTVHTTFVGQTFWKGKNIVPSLTASCFGRSS